MYNAAVTGLLWVQPKALLRALFTRVLRQAGLVYRGEVVLNFMLFARLRDRTNEDTICSLVHAYFLKRLQKLITRVRRAFANINGAIIHRKRIEVAGSNCRTSQGNFRIVISADCYQIQEHWNELFILTGVMLFRTHDKLMSRRFMLLQSSEHVNLYLRKYNFLLLSLELY